jgi:hypothetical protein
VGLKNHTGGIEKASTLVFNEVEIIINIGKIVMKKRITSKTYFNIK